MTPSEVANDVLHDTVEYLQTLIRRCMKLRQDDPMVFTLSDEIARRVARDIKLYGGPATSFSPQLLSMAAVVREHSRGGKFLSLPDWNTVADDDPRIKTHPRFQKTLNYQSRRPPTTLPTGTPLGVAFPEVRQVIEETSAIRSTVMTMPAATTDNDATSAGETPATPMTIKEEVGDTNIVPGNAITVTEDASDRTRATMPADSGHTAIAVPTKTSGTPALMTPIPVPASVVLEARPSAPVGQIASMATGMTLDPLTPPSPALTSTIASKRNGIFEGNEPQQAEERKAEIRPLALAVTRRSQRRKRKFISDDEETGALGTIEVKRKQKSGAHTAPAAEAPVPDDEGFWDKETRPAGWGQDSTIATDVQYSVRYHPRKCDKCIKLGVACIVLPDKKYGCTRLACAKCEEMKISCAIDGAGVRQRMQAMAKLAAKAATSAPAVNASVKRPRTRGPKSRSRTARPKSVRLKLPNTPPPSAQQMVVPDSLPGLENGAQATGSEPAFAGPRVLKTPEVGRQDSYSQPAQGRALDPEPTPRDILRSIQDLGRRFDLLATNERVDILEARVGWVEASLGLRLTALEQRISSSDTRWRTASTSLGQLSISLQEHRNDPNAHQYQASEPLYPPAAHEHPSIPPWRSYLTAGDGDVGISPFGRQYTHVWDQSLAMSGDVGTSASGARAADAAFTQPVREDSIYSSRLSTPSPSE
ncbi:hypothetical protein BDR07DRAFT_1382267 [Suillus spraguei]|nr:hypothetical protein BDR07DRAFT_1382267 [Suillus spraguei]